MKYLFFLTLLFSCISQASIAFVGKGHVAQAPIEMHLKVSDEGAVTGNYFYTKTKIPIDLKGELVEREIILETVNNPKINEVFKGNVVVFEGGISRITGKWFGEYGGYGDESEGYDFEVEGIANPLLDRKLTCEEMEAVPELAFKIESLGSGHGSPYEVDYHCPKSLSQLEFLQKLIGQADSIRSPSTLPQICTGSIIYAKWRYYHFALAILGYYPEGFSSRKKEKISGLEYFEEWSYQSLHNRNVYKDYMDELEKVRPLLTDWYVETHAIDSELAQRYTETALEIISYYGFGSYPYNWEPEDLVPFTEQAINGDYANFLHSINNASEYQMVNSLRRLLAHNANPEIIEKLASAIQAPSPRERSEPMLANAVYSPNNIQILLDAGFDPNHQNEFGKTALYYAIQFNQHASVKVLLDNGANVNHRYQLEKENKWHCTGINRWERTPLMHAAQHSDVAMIEILLEAGADLHAKDVKGSSAVDYAKENNKQDNEVFLSKEIERNPFLSSLQRNVEATSCGSEIARKYFKSVFYKPSRMICGDGPKLLSIVVDSGVNLDSEKFNGSFIVVKDDDGMVIARFLLQEYLLTTGESIAACISEDYVDSSDIEFHLRKWSEVKKVDNGKTSLTFKTGNEKDVCNLKEFIIGAEQTRAAAP